MKGDAWDPKALIQEAYRIDGITEPECRSIFVDWALSLPEEGAEATEVLPRLLERYGPTAPDHPMTQVLREGMAPAGRKGRKGGWRARRAAP